MHPDKPVAPSHSSAPAAPLWQWSAAELAQGIRTGLISSREATASCLERVAQVNPVLNAVVHVLHDSALAQADAADRAVARGEALGVLHGVPVTTKVNVDQIGCATTNGIVALKDLIATEDSPVVANLKAAGAVLFGRTNTPAFSFRWFTENDLHGRTLNPWSRDHTPGGSSGGASSAVASGMGPIAHGNDIAGSVRYPAYCTGLVGLRPSFGRVPNFLPSATAERPPGMSMMSVQGPLARTVQDVRLALQAMSSGDPRDPWWVPAPLEWPADARPLRVAVSTTMAGVAVHPEIVAAIERAAAWLSDAGYAVERVEPPDMAAAAALWPLIADTESRATMGPLVERLGDEGIQRAYAGMTRHTPVLDTEAYFMALARRSTLIRHWNLFMQNYPLVLGPLSAEPPFAWGLDVESFAGMDRIIAAQAPQFAVPVLGLPAVCAPMGRVNGLPVGVQLIGPRFREDLLLDAAHVLEARQPPVRPIDPCFGA
jgi:amidase